MNGFRCVFTLLLLASVLGGCASKLPPAPTESRQPISPAPPARPADQRAAVPSAMLVERQWLESWFKGTPVAIVQRGDHSITVDVPSEHAFDRGQIRIKPALAAVLDKVAESMVRLRFAHLPLVAAPEDPGSKKKSIALQRARQVHKHLRSRGVAAARLGRPTASTAAAVQLRLDVEEP